MWIILESWNIHDKFEVVSEKDLNGPITSFTWIWLKFHDEEEAESDKGCHILQDHQSQTDKFSRSILILLKTSMLLRNLISFLRVQIFLKSSNHESCDLRMNVVKSINLQFVQWIIRPKNWHENCQRKHGIPNIIIKIITR